MDDNQRIARENRLRLERERAIRKGPSYGEIAKARIAERNAWKATLPFYLKPWFWIVLGGLIISAGLAPIGVLIIAIHATWYTIARGNALK